MTTYKYSGHIIDQASQLPIVSPLGTIRVEAWDVDGGPGDMLGLARADHDGQFEVWIEEDDLQKLLGPGDVVLFFRVIDTGTSRLKADTRETLQWRPRSEPFGEGRIHANEDAVVDMTNLVVRGRLTTSSAPIANEEVTLEILTLRNEEVIDTTITGDRGEFKFEYSANAIPAGQHLADLRLSILEGATVVRLQVPPTWEVDFVAGGAELVVLRSSTAFRVRSRLCSAHMAWTRSRTWRSSKWRGHLGTPRTLCAPSATQPISRMTQRSASRLPTRSFAPGPRPTGMHAWPSPRLTTARRSRWQGREASSRTSTRLGSRRRSTRSLARSGCSRSPSPLPTP